MRAKLPALEKNILKYRSLQMVLLLHQVESFRSLVIGSIRYNDKFATHTFKPALLPERVKRPMEKVFQILVALEIINEKESQELQSIIKLRDQVSHRIHELVSDISAPRALYSRNDIYDYFALDRFEYYRDKIYKGMTKHFILEVSFRDISFEQAEATYKEELCLLDKRIERQCKQRKLSFDRVLK